MTPFAPLERPEIMAPGTIAPEIIQPEIIQPGDRSVRLVAAPHPLRTELVDMHVPAGLTIAEMLALAQADPALRRHAHVHVGEHYVPRDRWHLVRPKPGATVTARVAPTGGGGGGKNPLRTILTLAVLVAAAVVSGGALTPLLGAGFAAGTLGAAVAGAAIGLVGSLIVNAIAPPPKQKLGGLSGDTRDSPTLFLAGARNSARPFGKVPRVLGRHRMFAPLGALSYTETRGDEQYLHMLVTWGYGPLDIEGLKIGETPIAEFDGVTVQTRAGYADDDPIDLFPDDVFEEALSVELTQAGGWVTRTSQPDADRLSVDVTCPRGVVSYAGGTKTTHTVTVEVEYRAVGGGGGWTAAADIVVTEKRTSAIRRNRSWTVARGQYDVHTRRTTADAASDEIFDSTYWTALRSFTNEDPIGFPHPLARTALEIKATDQLSGAIDELNAVVTSILPDWDAVTETWVEQATSNPASLFREVLQGNGNARPLADARVDLDNLAEWHELNAAAGREFNMVIDFPTTVAELLHDIAACGRARPTRRDGGKWGVVIDRPQSVPVQLLTPRNSWGFRGRLVYPDLPHAWRIRFVNRDKGWRADERIVYADGYDASTATRFEGLEMPAITDTDQIWKDGSFHHAVALLRPHAYELNADPEHLLATRGSLVKVQHDMLLVGLAAGRIKTVTRDGSDNVTALTLDETVAMEAAKLYGLVIRTPEDVAVTGLVTTAPGESAALTLETPILAASVPAVVDDDDGLVGCLCAFGERGRETIDCIVKSIRRGANLSALLELVDAAPAVHAADSGAIPAYESGITVPPGIDTPAVADIRSDESVLLRDIDGALSSRMLVQLLRPSAVPAAVTGIEAAFRPAGSAGSWSYATAAADALEVSILDVEDGESYELRLRYTTAGDGVGGQPGRWGATHAHTVIGQSTLPPDPYGLVIEGDWLRWLHESPRDHRGFRVKSVPGTLADWMRGQYAHNPAAVLPQPELNVANLPRGTRVYMVKAVDVAGNESAGFASLTRDLGDTAVANVVLSRDLDTEGFPGIIIGGTVTAGVLEADDTTDYLPTGAAPYLADGAASYLPSEFVEVSYRTELVVPDSTEAPSRLLAPVTATGLWRLDYVLNPPFVAEGVAFDGSTYLARGAALTGAADARKGMLALSIPPGDVDSGRKILSTSPISIEVDFDSLGRLQIYLRGALGPTQALSFYVDLDAAAGDWATVLASWDTDAALQSRMKAYVGHTPSLDHADIFSSAFDIRFATSTEWTVGASPSGVNTLVGGLAEMTLWIGELVDLDVEADRLKLVDADGNPIDIGDDGSAVTGNDPILHLRKRPDDDPADFATNHGSGGDLALAAGALEAAEGGPTPGFDWRAWPDHIGVEADDELRLKWTAAGGAVQGTLSNIDLKFDVPDESEFHAALALLAAGTRVPIAKTYRSITVVNATLHGGGTAVTVEISDKDPDLGPLLIARNSSGTGVAATVDVHVQGVKG